MLDKALSFMAPHLCCGCEKVGTLLCEGCKYDIVTDPYIACVACGKGLGEPAGICHKCKVPYSRAWCVADRRDKLEKLINDYKFNNARAAYIPLAQLLHDRLPELPEDTVIVPVPTISTHIRQRGYDHMLLIARMLGKLRKLAVETCVERATNTKQRSMTANQREANAKVAFKVGRELQSDRAYLLIDDVITTGSTVKYAAKAMVDAGAGVVWVASISRQPLD